MPGKTAKIIALVQLCRNVKAIYTDGGSEKRLESDDPYSFTWQVLRTDTLEQIVFAFKFKNPWLISKYAKDKMIIEFLKPDEFSAS